MHANVDGCTWTILLNSSTFFAFALSNEGGVRVCGDAVSF